MDDQDFPGESGIKREPVGYGRPPVEHRFKPGNRASPGRPKGSGPTDRLRVLLEKYGKDGKGRDVQFADAFAEMILKNALKGDFRFVKELWDRLEGKAPVVVTGPDGGPIEHRIEGQVSLAALNDDELESLAAIGRKLAGGRPDRLPGGN